MNIDAFRIGFKASKANRFRITTTSLGGSNLNLDFYAKSASFPGSSIGMIPIAYQGRIIKFSGERQFQEWAIQLYDNTDSINIRTELEKMMDLMDHNETHLADYNKVSNWTIKHISDGSTTGSGKTMTLHNCWPVDVSPIDLNYEASDTFAEFTVTLAYDRHSM